MAMNLQEYEQAKFKLAAMLRAAEPHVSSGGPERAALRDLFGRLAEDRFNLAVVGRFNRGKSSLMNAMLGTTRLPVGVVPLTSVITTVSYGSSEQAVIEYQRGRLPVRIAVEELPAYVTQRGNPGNMREVRMARVQLPSELLRRGFHFIDTPGLGSSITENTRTTEAFLPEADALLLVTSYESPLSEEELRLLRNAASSASRVFLAVNKQDIVSGPERDEILDHICGQLAGVPGAEPRLLSVSARQALAARESGSEGQWAASGVPALLEQLERFLTAEKQAEFLVRMCVRVESLLRALPGLESEISRLHALRRDLSQGPAATAAAISQPFAARGAAWFASCTVCQRIEQKVYDFLCSFQNSIAERRDLRARFAAHGGLCDAHTWLYQTMASPLGTCLAYPEVLERLAAGLRDIAAGPEAGSFTGEVDQLRSQPETCEVCQVQRAAERAAVAELAGRARTEDGFAPHLCMAHFRMLLGLLENRDIAWRLLTAQAETVDRLAEDMRRYALKVDGVRSALLTKEEEQAHVRGLILLAGHPTVAGLRRTRG
jgi:GTP-binding protein EngB required for normal cell division